MLCICFFPNFSPFLEFVSITEKLCSFFYHFFRLCVAPSSIQRQLQLKYLEKGEFRDLNSVKSIRLDGNQLSVIIDNLFETQKYLEFLGKCWWLVDCIHAIHAHKRKHKWVKNELSIVNRQWTCFFVTEQFLEFANFLSWLVQIDSYQFKFCFRKKKFIQTEMGRLFLTSTD